MKHRPYEEPYIDPYGGRLGRGGRRRPFRFRLLGCLALLVLISFSAAAGIICWSKRESIQKIIEPMCHRAQTAASGPEMKGALDSLRKRVAEIQSQWEKQSEPGKLRQRIQELRKELVAQRDSAKGSAREYWEQIVRKSDALTSKTIGKSLRAPSEFTEVQNLIHSIEKLSASDKLKAISNFNPSALIGGGAKDSASTAARTAEQTPEVKKPKIPAAPIKKLPPTPAVPPPDYRIGD